MEENKQTTFTSTNCKNCNGKIEIDADKEVTVCPFCGTKYATAEILRESDAVRLTLFSHFPLQLRQNVLYS